MHFFARLSPKQHSRANGVGQTGLGDCETDQISRSNKRSERTLRRKRISAAPPPVAYRVLGREAEAAFDMVRATTSGGELDFDTSAFASIAACRRAKGA